ncbi:CBU_0978 family Dot/Icm T4SS effector [Coxiella burnetii]|uniref:CBU_0978 family Dot/Icm T4SS effector n=1 Tax=Coxiella burnetii TaxID=777 RepID=UPI000183D0CC|nr:CBU_0978 family Dot/Icm T4SS effector [Coxiella burnetii]ACJ18376.1 hypothetical membrane-associated protein [Coxiella burnetii CbuG_Q212]ATN66752.1 hypothetical protein AYM17_04945 [Coxiella burnetii]OYK86079.1 hypothetical protein CbuQ229_05170 [Coxiella burnetii]
MFFNVLQSNPLSNASIWLIRTFREHPRGTLATLGFFVGATSQLSSPSLGPDPEVFCLEEACQWAVFLLEIAGSAGKIMIYSTLGYLLGRAQPEAQLEYARSNQPVLLNSQTLRFLESENIQNRQSLNLSGAWRSSDNSDNDDDNDNAYLQVLRNA